MGKQWCAVLFWLLGSSSVLSSRGCQVTPKQRWHRGDIAMWGRSGGMWPLGRRELKPLLSAERHLADGEMERRGLLGCASRWLPLLTSLWKLSRKAVCDPGWSPSLPLNTSSLRAWKPCWGVAVLTAQRRSVELSWTAMIPVHTLDSAFSSLLLLSKEKMGF